MLPTLRRTLPFLLLATGGACAPARHQGLLSPITARVTNEVITADAATLEGWVQRADALRAMARTGREHAYASARAVAWAAFARDAYTRDPRDETADLALGEARRQVLALEHDSLPGPATETIATAERTRPDLWASLTAARQGGALVREPATLADAEMALVRAAWFARPGRGAAADLLADAAERACEVKLQESRATLLLNTLRAPEPVRVAVVQQGESIALFVPRTAPAPAPLAAPLTRVVHFALNSSRLVPASRRSIAAVVALLRAHPGVNVVIEGYTDARGDSVRNRGLATRRAEAVRRALESAALPLGRVTVAGVGPDADAMSHATPAAFARDRRVTLSFTDTAGVPLTVELGLALDAEHERDLQVEKIRGARAAARPPHRAASGRPGAQ